MHKPRVAILDMNNNAPNQGLRCIREIVSSFEPDVEWKIFDVRHLLEIPDTTYDIYISSGGPGSPLEQGPWREPYFQLLEELDRLEKHVFLICYSFQLACHYFELSQVTRRKSTSFGVLPVHKTENGKLDPLLRGLPDPYHAVDSRDWQVVEPKMDVFDNRNASILSLEKIRTHVEYERAIMAIRFGKNMVGTQFHPEADPLGMKEHLLVEDNKAKIIKNFDLKKYEDTLLHLEDPDKITLTHHTILPQFIRNSLTSVISNQEVVNIYD